MNEIIYKVLSTLWQYIGANGLIFLVIGALGNHFLEVRKTRLAQKLEFQNELGKKVFEATIHAREVESRLTGYEIYKPEQMKSQAKISSFDDNAFYPSIMNDKDVLVDYLEEVSQCRRDYDRYLSYASSASLLSLEHYLMDLTIYIGSVCENNDDLQLVGCIVIIDLQKMQKRIDSVLVSELNHPKFEVVDKNSPKWKRAIKAADRKLRQGCHLDKIRELANQVRKEEMQSEEQEAVNA